MTIGYSRLGHGGESVLMLHDWSCDHTTYDPVTPFLDGTRFTYVLADLRGYGLSREIDGKYTVEEAAKDCLELADSLGWGQFHVIGHSMTGMVSQRIALDATGRVKSAIAVCPVSAAGFPMDETTWSFFQTVTEDDAAYREMIRSLCSGVLSEQWLDHKTRWNRATTAPHSRKAYLRMWSQTNFSDEARGLPTPYLILTGEHDIEGLRAEAMKATFLAMHPNAELKVIPNTGHYPMQECPPFFATVVEEFLGRHAA
jgi:pimeloyl-ACP methyl ester carboxylesterase